MLQLTVDPHADKSYVRQLKRLISSLLSVSKFQHSVYGQASQFFQQDTFQNATLTMLQQAWDQAQQQLRLATAKTEARLVLQAQQCQQAFVAEQNKQQQQRLNNQSQLYMLCQQFLQLTEGNNRAETILRSSKMLGTLQLLAPSEGEQIATVQQKYKPLYKATLSLRLLDHLLAQGLITNSYILQKAQQRKAAAENQ